MKRKSEAPEPRPRLPLDAPWFEEPLSRIAQARSRGQLPQSLLVHAHPGAGGAEIARRMAQLLLCEAESPEARLRGCGECRGCQRVATGAHPDYFEVEPEDSKQIRIDQVRDVLEELSVSSYEGRATVVVFSPAEAINTAAANALLKNLEEPRRDAYLVLITSQPSAAACLR